jgi:hypothetical protein
MPLYRDKIAQELEDKKSDFQTGIGQDVVDEFQDAAGELSDLSREEIEERLDEFELPAALPTEEFEENDGLTVQFEESREWESHEAVNKWARSQIEGAPTISADGSQIDPVSEFEKPVGLVQAVWIANNHTADGDYEEDVETKVLTPEDLLFEDPNTGLIQVDDEEVSISRFELEMKVLERQIKKHADNEATPVVLYDGPLVLSFAQMFSSTVQDRYSEALARLLAASEHHGVPVIGYTAGSKASDLAKMIERLGLVDVSQSVRDYQLVDGLVDEWGDRTIIFNSRRDNSLNWLQTTYHGQEYDFSEDILFTYLKTDSGPQVDRIDFPRWVQEEGLVDHVMAVLRAEAGIGRGYPEILQSVDADAVISRQEREEFLRMYQDFSEENDIDLRWNNKALSKKRRRR